MNIVLDDDGFLGEAADKAGEQIHEVCRDYLDVAYAVNRVSQRTQFPVHNLDGQRMTATGLLMKLQNDTQSVILLAERGLPVQAMSMLRVAFEALVRLELVHEDPEFWKQYRDSHELSRNRSLGSPIKGKTGVSPDDAAKDEIRAGLADAGGKIKREDIERLPDIEDLVERADRLAAKRLGVDLPKEGGQLTESYHSLYQLGNQTIHSMPSSIHDYWTSDESGFVPGFVQGPRMDGLNLILVTAAGVLVSALQVVKQLFDDVKVPSEAAEVIERFKKVKEQLASDEAEIDEAENRPASASADSTSDPAPLPGRGPIERLGTDAGGIEDAKRPVRETKLKSTNVLTPDLSKLRRFALAVAAVLLAHTVLGLQVVFEEGVQLHGAVFRLGGAWSLTPLLVVLSAYGGWRYWFFAFGVLRPPSLTRRLVLASAVPRDGEWY